RGGPATPERRGRASGSPWSPSPPRPPWRAARRSTAPLPAARLPILPPSPRRPSPVSGVALLAPRIAVVVVAERFPESRLVVLHHAKLPQPLGALPEVEV